MLDMSGKEMGGLRSVAKKKPKAADNAFAQKIAKILKYGTKDFDNEITKLCNAIATEFPEESISEHTIRSWIYTGKYPKRKNQVIVAKVLGLTTDELISADTDQPKPGVVMDESTIKSIESMIEKVLPLLHDKFMRIDTIPAKKVELIKKILVMNSDENISFIDHNVEMLLKVERKEKDMGTNNDN